MEEPLVYKTALAEWENVLKKLPYEQILIAIDYCTKRYDFPPSIAEFIKAAYNIPPCDAAFMLDKNGNSFLQEVWTSIDSFTFRQMTHEEGRRYFNNAYETILEKFLENFDKN